MPDREPIIIVGMGELGGVLARGLLRLGHPVFPVLRDTPRAELAERVAPALVIVAVGEAELDAALASTPARWKDRLVLLQNELVPATWQSHALAELGVLVVWFEKKPGFEPRVLLPSVAWGRGAATLVDALARLGIPARVVTEREALVTELIVKNLYILVTNIAGLRVGGTVAELWSEHRELALAVAADVLAVQARLTDRALSAEALIPRLREAIDADPAHRCAGRSAPARLARALTHAARFGIAVPALRAIAEEQASTS